MINITVFIGVGAFAIGAVLLWYAKVRNDQANSLLRKARNRSKDIKREVEAERREALLKVKDEIYKKRSDFELEMKRERSEQDRLKNKLNQRQETLDKKEGDLDEFKRELQKKERDLLRGEDSLRSEEARVKQLHQEVVDNLERLSAMTREEAKQTLLDMLEAEVTLASQKWIQKVEEEARNTAKEKASQIVVTSMQRFAAGQVSQHSSGVVHLPSDDMKGRIIGKEGRNIKALEMATGMEFIIGDTPEIITISGFNPIRREVARRSLEQLISDGRINPTRIEETVDKCEKELNEIIEEYGRETILEFNLQGVHKEIITLLGRLQFRTSFSQNVLDHSKEVGRFAQMIAEELGLDGGLALRAGLLHDIGKAVSAEIEGPHAQIGADIAKRCGERGLIINGIAAHHEEVPFESIYSPIVVVADIISASRPGARRETLAAYLKRLTKLEEIANSFEGVKKAYALQAGREVRIIVQEDRLTDDQAKQLARTVAKKIEENMNFPGQIKVNVIREKRSIEYAR